MELGTIITLQNDKGYGFIHSASADYFFHASDLAEGLEFSPLLQERRVKFNVVQAARGPRAANIQFAE